MRRWSRCSPRRSTPRDAANGPTGWARVRMGTWSRSSCRSRTRRSGTRTRLESRALMLRVFLLTDGRGDYRLMPGGLSRIAGADRQIVSGQRGGSSKDTWILSDVPVEPASPVERRATHRKAAGELTTSSRAAENLFWLGRYAERSENSARLLRAVLGHLTDDSSFPGGLRPAFLRACERQQLLARREADEIAGGRQQSDSDDGGRGSRAHRWHLRSPPQAESGLQHRADGSRGGRRARPSVDRQLASPQSADAAVPGMDRGPRGPRRRPRADRRLAGRARRGRRASRWPT